jgi:hypothetical protein
VKDLYGSASAPVSAPSAECIELLAAVDGYPVWCPAVICEVDVLERRGDGVPTRACATVHLALGPVSHNFRFEIAVVVEPGSGVVVSRTPDHPSDPERLELRWRVKPARLEIELAARLDVPRFLPVGHLGDRVAQEFVEAASRALAGSSPKVSASSS